MKKNGLLIVFWTICVFDGDALFKTCLSALQCLKADSRILSKTKYAK